MTTAFSSLIGLALPVEGELDGQWGDVVNNAATQYLDIAIAGTQTLSTNADATLVQTFGTDLATNIGATTAQYAVIRWTASNGATTRNINVPNSSKTYVVINDGTGSIVLRGVTGPTTGITITSGEKCVAAWNGSDFVKISTSTALTGTTPVSSGGTGITTTTAYSVVFSGTTATGNFQASAGPGTTGYLLTSNGAGALPTFQANTGVTTGKSIAMAMIFGF